MSQHAHTFAWVLRSAQVAGRLRLFTASGKRFERRAGMPHLRWFVDDLNSMNVERSRRITHRNAELPSTRTLRAHVSHDAHVPQVAAVVLLAERLRLREHSRVD